MDGYAVVTEIEKDGKHYVFYRSLSNPKDELMTVDDSNPEVVNIKQKLVEFR